MPEDMPEDMPGRMPEDIPDRMPEDMSDRMPEDLPVAKRINVMVGMTRSKVFFCAVCVLCYSCIFSGHALFFVKLSFLSICVIRPEKIYLVH
jgi:hypothetical protein